jgi:hypothetical protein
VISQCDLARLHYDGHEDVILRKPFWSQFANALPELHDDIGQPLEPLFFPFFDRRSEERFKRYLQRSSHHRDD